MEEQGIGGGDESGEGGGRGRGRGRFGTKTFELRDLSYKTSSHSSGFRHRPGSVHFAFLVLGSYDSYLYLKSIYSFFQGLLQTRAKKVVHRSPRVWV